MALLVPVLGIEEVRAHRGWFLFMGVALIILGTIAIGSAEVMTMVSVMLIGWLLLFGGLFEVVHGFARRAWGGFFVNLMGGLLYAGDRTADGHASGSRRGDADLHDRDAADSRRHLQNLRRLLDPDTSSGLADPERCHLAVPRILDHELVARFRPVGHRAFYRHRHDFRRLD